jgi:hypothetical protein
VFRNVCLNYKEWSLLTKELGKNTPSGFKRGYSKHDLKEWEVLYPNSEMPFKRVNIYEFVEKLKTPALINSVSKSYWREHDISDCMQSKYNFIGFVFNHVKDVDPNTPPEVFERIRTEMNRIIDNSKVETWGVSSLTRLYEDVVNFNSLYWVEEMGEKIEKRIRDNEYAEYLRLKAIFESQSGV